MRNIQHINGRLVGAGTSLFAMLIGIFLFSSGLTAQESEIVLIGNAEVPERPLSKAEVQNIFLGKVTKIDKTKVVFAILKTGDIHEQFLAEYLSRTPSQYTKYWKKLVFTGKGKSPKAFATEDELIQYVEQTQGAIGYISVATAQNLDNQHIRQLTAQ